MRQSTEALNKDDCDIYNVGTVTVIKRTILCFLQDFMRHKNKLMALDGVANYGLRKNLVLTVCH